jgi:hypothetical protein
MVLENLDQANKFVDYAEQLIEILNYDDVDDIYETIIHTYNEIKDYETFKKFYISFLKDCPNLKILNSTNNNYENEDVIKDLFNKANNEITKMVKCSFGSNDLKRQSKKYITEIFSYEVKLIKDYFKIE